MRISIDPAGSTAALHPGVGHGTQPAAIKLQPALAHP
jgi:hypothetical protein